MNPYSPIRKVPLDFEGISSSAYGVQIQKEDGWKEAGVVGANYMLLPNEDVRDAAEQVSKECNIDFTHNKTFFNGKNFIYSMKSNHVAGTIKKGDDVALGLQFWNSYDGSRSFGFSMMLYRLACTNGMMSKNYFNTYRFKHEPNSENWEENLEQVVENINTLSHGSDRLDTFISNLRKLTELDVTMDRLGDLRHNHLNELPVGLWGQIVDRFTVTNKEDHSGWDLLNAATDILWHKENPTVASYNQNQVVIDGLCKAVA
tara:strand:- start:1928 stop:2704 length:777 start_codon:yes stop_codon:yes gene_type:complete